MKLQDMEYDIIKEYKEGIVQEDELIEKFTDYFKEYDYVVGDYAYGKLRLKGFYDENNKKKKDINDYSKVEDYIGNYCAFNCSYFILKKTIHN